MKQAAKLTLVISLYFWVTNAYAQSALDVRVTDQEGRCVPNAALTRKRGEIATHGVTGPDGGFRFLGLRAGEYELVTVADGYYPAEAEMVLKPR